MPSTNVISLAPALARQRRAMGGVVLLSWDNHFPRGIEDLWVGPFVPLRSATIVRLFVN